MKDLPEFELINERLAILLGLRVQRCGLLIWPDEEGADEASTSLNLRFASKSGSEVEVTIGICADGQTPRVEFDTWPEQFMLIDLKSRINIWQKPEFWNPESPHPWEFFDVGGAAEYKGVVGHVLENVFVFCFKSKPSFPTGVRLDFDSGSKLFVVPGSNGSAVFRELPMNWFPSPCDAVRIAKPMEI